MASLGQSKAVRAAGHHFHQHMVCRRRIFDPRRIFFRSCHMHVKGRKQTSLHLLCERMKGGPHGTLIALSPPRERKQREKKCTQTQNRTHNEEKQATVFLATHKPNLTRKPRKTDIHTELHQQPNISTANSQHLESLMMKPPPRSLLTLKKLTPSSSTKNTSSTQKHNTTYKNTNRHTHIETDNRQLTS